MFVLPVSFNFYVGVGAPLIWIKAKNYKRAQEHRGGVRGTPCLFTSITTGSISSAHDGPGASDNTSSRSLKLTCREPSIVSITR